MWPLRSRKKAPKTPTRKAEEEAKENVLASASVQLTDSAPKKPEPEPEFRYGMYINPRPAVALTTPPTPELTEEYKADRIAKEAAATAGIPADLDKYIKIVRNVSLFSDMGEDELVVAAQNLEVHYFLAGEMIYDEGETGHDCWVVESGTVISSMLIPGIAGSGWEWKETRPYRAGKFGSFFGERGLRRGEPRVARMVCRTDVIALRITRDSFVTCARMREYKENLLRSVRLFEQMTDEQIGKLAAGPHAAPRRTTPHHRTWRRAQAKRRFPVRPPPPLTHSRTAPGVWDCAPHSDEAEDVRRQRCAPHRRETALAAPRRACTAHASRPARTAHAPPAYVRLRAAF